MVLPLKVLNRLRLGKDVAAEIAASRPGYRAWIYVMPIREIRLGNWGAYQPEDAQGNPFEGFVIRRLEINERFTPYLFTTDQFLRDHDTLDNFVVVANEAELSLELERWLNDASMLRLPDIVECPNLCHDTTTNKLNAEFRRTYLENDI